MKRQKVCRTKPDRRKSGKNTEVLNEYENIIKTEIGEMNLCTAGRHSIKIIEMSLINKSSHRIPIHYEDQIKQEILMNLSLGIIRKSQSPYFSSIIIVMIKDGFF